MGLSMSFVAGCGVVPGKTPQQRVEPPGSNPPGEIGLKAITPIADGGTVAQTLEQPDAGVGTTIVTMEGQFIARLDDDGYTFVDDTGQVRIEADGGQLPFYVPLRVTARRGPNAMELTSWRPLDSTLDANRE
jgi:uncharacterized protein YdeI (BOF family)